MEEKEEKRKYYLNKKKYPNKLLSLALFSLFWRLLSYPLARNSFQLTRSVTYREQQLIHNANENNVFLSMPM